MATDYWTTKHPDGWQVKGEGNQRATSIHRTQSEAWAESQNRARKTRGEAYLTGRDGQIRERNTYGHDPRKSRG
ncbi:DUF2188 domain-containing protein [Blastomonas sp. CACIA14H2]|uniref:DUF2188 domain-containing protein n=1 Tax=Blastomonas sp. CACIA14H2 TaxID=1419876 RepID=UPI0026CE751A